MYLLYLTVGVGGEAQSDIFHMEKKGGDVKIAIVDQHQEGRIECQWKQPQRYNGQVVKPLQILEELNFNCNFLMPFL